MLRALLKLATVTIYSSVLLYTLDDGYPRLKKSVPISVETTWVTNAETNYTEIMPPTCDYEGQSTNCGTCTMYVVVNFDLYYWPVGPVSDRRNVTIKPSQTDFSAIISRTTFTSPSVYILMEQAFAVNLCRPVGLMLTIVIVSVMPNSFSSVKDTVNYYTSNSAPFQICKSK